MTVIQRGLLQVYTGNGKGKTTAAVGLAVRAHGAGLRVCFVQFIKGGAPSSELAVLESLGIPVIRPAEKSAGVMRGRASADDANAVYKAWGQAREAMLCGEWDIVVMDELHIAFKHGLLKVEEALEALAARPAHVEVVTTGRWAPDEWLLVADLVTEMLPHKHPLAAGVAARRGIEF